ncbi:Kinesin-Like Protein Kif21A [Manis pentadactyla]|nr:Kinesin-Like Protein Kif21A [Manis pentadactyla]
MSIWDGGVCILFVLLLQKDALKTSVNKQEDLLCCLLSVPLHTAVWSSCISNRDPGNGELLTVKTLPVS